MKSAFGSRRKARRVGQDDDAEPDAARNQAPRDSGGEQDNPSVVRRPPIASQASSKPKKKSALRLSFGPGEAESEDVSSPAEAFTPKKSRLSRQAIEKNALRKSLVHGLPSERLPIRAGESEDRPSYSKDYLNELKSSTPSMPRDLGREIGEEGEIKNDALDVYGKFGEDMSSSLIPSQAEILEKKQRRARIAHEQEYISLDRGDNAHDEEEEEEDENGEIVLRPRQKWGESRLVREDEDLAEGFDDFVEDGKVTLGKKAEKEQQRRRRMEMKEMINEAEASSEDDSDGSEAERKAAYESAQTRAGTYGTAHRSEQGSSRARTPPRITPLPSVTAALERLQSALSSVELSRMQKVKQMEDLRRERAEIAAREVEIQELLKEAGTNYARLSAEAGLGGGANGSALPNSEPGDERRLLMNGGLESIGDTARALQDED